MGLKLSFPECVTGFCFSLPLENKSAVCTATAIVATSETESGECLIRNTVDFRITTTMNGSISSTLDCFVVRDDDGDATI